MVNQSIFFNLFLLYNIVIMALSCTFSISNNKTHMQKYTNSQCFAKLNSKYIQNKSKITITIEPRKQFFTKNQIYEYLKDLKEMGFNFFYYKQLVNKDIKIYINSVNKDISLFKLRLFYTLIRFLWEGKYPVVYRNDNFYIIINYYLQIKKILIKQKYTKFELLCIACNLFCLYSFKEKLYINGGHFLSYSNSTSVHIRKNVNNLHKINTNPTIISIFSNEEKKIPNFHLNNPNFLKNKLTLNNIEKFIKHVKP